MSRSGCGQCAFTGFYVSVGHPGDPDRDGTWEPCPFCSRSRRDSTDSTYDRQQSSEDTDNQERGNKP